jgi:alpha-amylase
MNAAAFPFVTDGVPYVYYGQEQGFKGGNDPDNREVRNGSNLPPLFFPGD